MGRPDFNSRIRHVGGIRPAAGRARPSHWLYAVYAQSSLRGLPLIPWRPAFIRYFLHVLF